MIPLVPDVHADCDISSTLSYGIIDLRTEQKNIHFFRSFDFASQDIQTCDISCGNSLLECTETFGLRLVAKSCDFSIAPILLSPFEISSFHNRNYYKFDSPSLPYFVLSFFIPYFKVIHLPECVFIHVR